MCGSLEHPAPAAGDTTTPDEAAVTEAERAQQAAADRRASAAATAAAARAQHAAAAATADGATPATAAEAVRSARDAVDAARAADTEQRTATRLLAELDDRAAQLDAVVSLHRGRPWPSRRPRSPQPVPSWRAPRPGSPPPEATSPMRAAARVDLLRTRRAALAAAEEAVLRHRAARAADLDARERLAATLADAGIPDVATARAAALPAAERLDLERRVRIWETARDGATVQPADPDVAGAPAEPADEVGAADAKSAALDVRDAAVNALAAARALTATAQDLATAVAAVESGIAADRAQLDVVGPLAEVVRGGGSNAFRMRLESYVLAARLEQVAAAATVRLQRMSSGRYTLVHSDDRAGRGRSGLGLHVVDAWTGRERDTATLSGGETFFASLALALGLADVVTDEAGGVRLDTLFIDEGFGSLDRRTLDTAMETLDSLRAGGRTVGLISHVEAMQEDIPAGLHVERLPDGSSTVRSRVPAAV